MEEEEEAAEQGKKKNNKKKNNINRTLTSGTRTRRTKTRPRGGGEIYKHIEIKNTTKSAELSLLINKLRVAEHDKTQRGSMEEMEEEMEGRSARIRSIIRSEGAGSSVHHQGLEKKKDMMEGPDN